MASKGKSDKKRISDLESAVGRVAADLDAISRQSETFGGGSGPILTPFLPVAPLLRPELLSPLAGALFAITPLPRTISAGSGTCQCKPEGDKSRRTVHNITGNAAFACQVENVGTCGSVKIQVWRAGAEVETSPDATPGGGVVSLGPFAVVPGDTVVVICKGDPAGDKACKFNWQINLA